MTYEQNIPRGIMVAWYILGDAGFLVVSSSDQSNSNDDDHDTDSKSLRY